MCAVGASDRMETATFLGDFGGGEDWMSLFLFSELRKRRRVSRYSIVCRTTGEARGSDGSKFLVVYLLPFLGSFLVSFLESFFG